MKGLYHYQGMPLHYLSEDGRFAIYCRKYDPKDKPVVRFNPFMVYELRRWFSPDGGYGIKHKLVDRYADLYSAVQRVRQEQGYGI